MNMSYIETVEDAKEFMGKYDNFPPQTWDPYVNFLFDVAVGIVDSADQWDDQKSLYWEEIEVYKSDKVDIEPYEVDELKNLI